jgi:REP-associated tyrosine transposase
LFIFCNIGSNQGVVTDFRHFVIARLGMTAAVQPFPARSLLQSAAFVKRKNCPVVVSWGSGTGVPPVNGHGQDGRATAKDTPTWCPCRGIRAFFPALRGWRRLPPFGVCDLAKRLSLRPCRVASILCCTRPLYHRVYTPGQVQFLTARTYRRAPLFRSERFCRAFVRRLEEVRQEWHFRLAGWVLMPDHFHLLMRPQPAATVPLLITGLKEETAKRLLKTLRQNLHHPCCRKMLGRRRLPSTVHDESRDRLWQRRFYPFNIFTEKKFQEKLDYMHNNPVTRGRVSSPGEWPWSSSRFYYLEDASIMRMDRLDQP